MTIKPTAEEIIAEGQFRDDYFPNCADHAAVCTLIDVWINSAYVRVKRHVGTTTIETTDEDIQQELHDCVMYFALARCWEAIRSVMIGYDAEALPPEYVNPDQAADSRDFWANEASSIIARYSQDSPTIKSYVGSFDTAGDDTPTASILGLTY